LQGESDSLKAMGEAGQVFDAEFDFSFYGHGKK
jgi:hypothetical protein